jgi:ribonuclease HI
VGLTTELWTDGACSGNPGPGGWAYILVARGDDGEIAKLVEGHGGEPATTNNRMEIAAVVEGLRALNRPTTLKIVSDSSYVIDAFAKGWIDKWQRNGWKSGRNPVKNQDLWRALLDAVAAHDIQWERVKGHASSPLNNRADELAVYERDVHAGRIPVGTPTPPSAIQRPGS